MRNRFTRGLFYTGLAYTALSFSLASRAPAALLYQWDFDETGGTGTSVTPVVTPNGVATDGGVLTMANYGGFAFTPANLYSAGGGGVSGSANDYAFDNSASVSNNSNPGGIAYSSATNTVNALPNLTVYTLTMWLKPTTAELTAQSRLMMIGPTSTFDEGAGGLWVGLNAGKIQTGGSSSGINATVGTTLVANAWNFVAIQVDLAASNIFFDPAMRTATGNAESDSLALYQGDATDNNYKYTAQSGAANGTMNFSGTQDYVQLLNRASNATRAFQGQGDDFRIYNELLTTSQLQALAAEAPVPEPASLLTLSVCGAGLLIRRRKI